MSDPKQITTTRWRDLTNPVSPLDPLDCASLFHEGHLPPGFVMVLTDELGQHIWGPLKFSDQIEADKYLEENPRVAMFLVFPSPLL